MENNNNNKNKEETDKKAAEEKIKTIKIGMNPEEFFKKIMEDRSEPAAKKEEGAAKISKGILSETDFLNHIIDEGIKAVAETVVSRIDNVEIELKHNRIRINFK